LGANRWWSNRELTQQFGDGQQQVAAASVTIVTALGVDTVQMSHATGKIWFRFEVVFMEKCPQLPGIGHSVLAKILCGRSGRQP